MSIGRAVVALAAVMLGLASCGSEEGPRQQVGETLTELREHFDGGDFEQVCSGMTPAARKRVAAAGRSGGCALGLARLLPRESRTVSRRRPGRRDVVGVRVVRDRARATVTLNDRIPGTLDFVRSDGGWKLDGIAVRPVPGKSRWKAAVGVGESFSIYSVRAGERVLCPNVRKALPTAVEGGCVLRVSSGSAPFVFLTAFGDFEVARCRGSYRLYLDSAISRLAHGVTFASTPSCRGVERCRNGETGLTYPWQGEKMPSKAGAVILRMDICVRTPVGRVRGLQMIELRRRRGDWTAHPADYPVGDRSVQIGGRWDVEPDDFVFGRPLDPF